MLTNVVSPNSVPNDPAILDTFKCHHPKYTYPFYGTEERIYGHSNIKIQMTFYSNTLFAHLWVHSPSESVEEEERERILAPIKAKMAVDGWTEDWSEFRRKCLEEQMDVKLLGTLVDSMIKDNEEYRIYHVISIVQHFMIIQDTFGSKEFCKFHQRLQIFLLFFIEGSSFIDENDLRWHIFPMYQFKRNASISVVYQV